MVKLVREAAQQGQVVAAICHAGWMLVSAGVVKGKKVTSFFSIKDDMVVFWCPPRDCRSTTARHRLAADRAPLRLGEGAEQMHLVDAASKIRGPEQAESAEP
jgi:hypothetical protein